MICIYMRFLWCTHHVAKKHTYSKKLYEGSSEKTIFVLYFSSCYSMYWGQRESGYYWLQSEPTTLAGISRKGCLWIMGQGIFPVMVHCLLLGRRGITFRERSVALCLQAKPFSSYSHGAWFRSSKWIYWEKRKGGRWRESILMWKLSSKIPGKWEVRGTNETICSVIHRFSRCLALLG